MIWGGGLGQKILLRPCDSVFGKRVLMYWENRRTPDDSQMNGFMVGIGNYIFLERGKPHLSKNV